MTEHHESHLDSYSLMIVSKHFATTNDFLNAIQVSKKYCETLDKFRYNPISNIKLFTKIETQYLYNPSDARLKHIKRFLYCYPVNYKKYLELRGPGVRFRNVQYSNSDRENYGDKLPDVINSISEKCYRGSMMEGMKIPSVMKEFGIFSYFDCVNMTSIQLPTTLTKIAAGCFYNCYSLKSIDIPLAVTALESKCFFNCNSLSSLELPPYLETIGDYCCYHCTRITELNLPKNVSSLDICCFKECYNLTSITIPSAITCIENDIFMDCTKLKNMILGRNVEVIKDNAFCNCISLKSMIFSNCLKSIGKYSFSKCGLSSIELPNIQEVSGSSFIFCNQLQRLILPQNCIVTSGFSVENCIELTDFILPTTITSLENNCFKNCSRLQSIIIPNNVISIGSYCFDNCSSLMNLSLPSNLQIIEKDCFNGASFLTSIVSPDCTTYDIQLPQFIANLLKISNITCNNIEYTPTDYALRHSISEGVHRIGNRCFANSKIHEVSIPQSQINSTSEIETLIIPTSVVEIGDHCFENSILLTSITLGDDISIGKSCFCSCSNLENVKLPSNLKVLESFTFSNCLMLKTIVIPTSVTCIGMRCFDACQSLQSIHLGDSLVELGCRCFQSCSSLTSITLPPTIQTIGDSCFLYCKIIEMKLPESCPFSNFWMGRTGNLPQIIKYTNNEQIIKCNNNDHDHDQDCNCIIS